MNVYHQAKMSLRHYLSFTQLWRWVLPLAYIGQTASKCTLSGHTDGSDDGKGAVFLTQEIQKPGILVDFDAYFGHASKPVMLQVWRRVSSDNYSVHDIHEIQPTRDLGLNAVHINLPKTKCMRVNPGDRLGIKIRETPANDSRIQFEHHFSVAATIIPPGTPVPTTREGGDPKHAATKPVRALQPAKTTLTPKPRTTSHHAVNPSSTEVVTTKPPNATTTPTTSLHEVNPSAAEVVTTKPPNDTTSLMSPPSTTSTLEEKSSALDKTTLITDTTSLTSPPSTTSTLEEKSLIIAAVIPVILVLTLIVILFVIIARMRRRKPGDGELEQDYNDIYLDGGPYTSIRSENTDSMAKGPRALRKDRPRLKLDPDTPLQVNPDRVPNVRKVTYLQWISDMMSEVGLTGSHPNPVKNAGRVPGSSTGDGDDDGERYLKPISERSGFDNPGCDVFAYQTDDVFFAQLDPGQFMLLSGAIDSSDRPTRLPWGIPGDSPMTSQSSEDDQTYIDMNRYHYSPIPRRERSNGSDGGLAGNGVADRGPHTYLELLPDDDDVTGQRSKQGKYVAVPQTRTVPPVHRTVVSM